MISQKDWKYIKAVPNSDPYNIVYAYQFKDGEWFFSPAPRELSPAGKVVVLELCGELHFVSPDEWLVWHPVTVGYEFLSDDEFRAEYNLHDDLPPKIRDLADRFPSFEEWVELQNKQADRGQ